MDAGEAMKGDDSFCGSWAVPSGDGLIPFGDANVGMLLSAASGLVGALVQANGLPLAVGIAGTYLQMSPDEGVCPISALSKITSRHRTFEGICLTEFIDVRIDDRTHRVNTGLIRRLRLCRRPWWQKRQLANLELVDGSEYRRVQMEARRLDFLTLIGRQSIPLPSQDLTVHGHTVAALTELRNRLEQVLERHRQALVQTVGRETLERYFRQAA